jgi:hypothetical protein
LSKTSKKQPTVRLPTVEENGAIIAAAQADPDAQPLTDEQLQAMVPLRAVPRRPKRYD